VAATVGKTIKGETEMKRSIVLVLTAMFLTACGGAGGWAVKYKGKDIKFDKKVGLANFRPDLGEGQIYIANFEPQYRDNSVMTIADTQKPGEAFVGIYFKNNNSENFKDSVKAGDVSDRIKSVWISNGDTRDRVSFAADGKVTGKLVITEVTADAIKGTIDIKKDDSSVSGPFEAKILSKSL
jgi:hypothetical protein